MKVRIVDHTGQVIARGQLNSTHRYNDNRSDAPREVVRVQEGNKYVCKKEGPSWGHATITLDELTPMPLWYGGSTTAMGKTQDFSLPSGLHNVWGCGNDFDTDAFKIHPDDLPAVIEASEK